MKKSTLITTIAMIVVVVVALSTATYAWFTTANTTQAAQTMTTEAASGWFLYGGTVTPAADNAAENYKATTNIAYSQTSAISLNLMNTGLFAPAAALATTLTNANGNDLAATYQDTQFFIAKQEGFGVLSEADVTHPVSFKHSQKDGENVSSVNNLNAIRIVNGNPSEETCHLTILVYVEPGDNATQALLAGKGFTFYMVTASGNTFTTGYYYASGFSSGENAGTGAVGDKALNAGGNTSTAKSASSVDYYTTTTVANRDYATVPANNKGVFGSVNMSAGTYYYTIDIELGNIGAGAALNTVFYAWFDGWALDTTAQGGTVGVHMAFGSATTTVAVSPV